MPLLSDEIDCDALAARGRVMADRFALPLRDHNWRGNPGDHAGAGVGSSLDFQDHRQYLPGDDPRHINWQAYARTGDYTLKLYREEVRPVVEIIFDVSGSMFGEADKARRSLELFYFAFAAVEKAGASALVRLVKGDRWRPVEAHGVLTHHWRDIAGDLPDTEASASPQLAAIPFRPRSLRLFLSDLLFPASPETLIRHRQHGGGRVMVLCPYARSEADPGWEGNYDFVDTETGAHHDRRVDPSLLKRYLETYHRHFERWKTAALKARAPLARVPAHGPFEEAVKLEAMPAGALQLA